MPTRNEVYARTHHAIPVRYTWLSIYPDQFSRPESDRFGRWSYASACSRWLVNQSRAHEHVWRDWVCGLSGACACTCAPVMTLRGLRPKFWFTCMRMTWRCASHRNRVCVSPHNYTCWGSQKALFQGDLHKNTYASKHRHALVHAQAVCVLPSADSSPRMLGKAIGQNVLVLMTLTETEDVTEAKPVKDGSGEDGELWIAGPQVCAYVLCSM